MKVWAVVPARGGSKAIPGKNIRCLGGKPLIAHTLEAALAAASIDRLSVSTDCPNIAAACEKWGVQVPSLRPAHLSGDSARVQDAVLHELGDEANDFDYVLLLQPTAPFRTSADIDGAVALAAEHRANSVVSFVQEETRHPWYMYQLHPGEGSDPDQVRALVDYPVGTPRQEFPPMLYRNGAIYLTHIPWFLEHRSFVSPDVIPYLMPESRSVNLDTEEDFRFAEWRLHQSDATT